MDFWLLLLVPHTAYSCVQALELSPKLCCFYRGSVLSPNHTHSDPCALTPLWIVAVSLRYSYCHTLMLLKKTENGT